MDEFFSKVAQWVSNAAGSWQASVLAVSIILAWVLGGFYFGFTDTLYQLAINSGTTIVTFIMVFLIQHTQNKDARAVQIKLNEIICALEKADNRLIDLEHDSDQAIEAAQKMTEAKKGGHASEKSAENPDP